MQSIKSTCPYCGVGCGLDVDTSNASRIRVVGDEKHPSNFGRLCSKGSALAETLIEENQPSRIEQPSVDGEIVSWDQATQTIADKIKQSIEEHGRDSVAFYLSGQLLTEDYYAANKLMKGFIGTANVDTNSRLCMASAVVGYKRAFGADAVPCSYEDLDHAELIVLIGSNAAWTHPILYQRMVAAKQANPALKVVLVDPRETVSCDIADLHLAIAPSSDNFLFQGLAKHLLDSNSYDQAYIEAHTEGYEQLQQSLIDDAEALTLESVAKHCDVEQADLVEFYDLFAGTKKAISFYSQGINQSATGTDKCNAIINCHLISGKIGYEGAGPFSITGQPNAMGGREVGGLANQLAAHMDFDEQDCDRVQRFWQSPTIAREAGLKAVDLFDAIDNDKIKVLWVMATNPAVSLPESNKVRRALAKCPTVIVSDITHTDTTEFASIVLPAEGWSEKNGTVTNSERRISRQTGFKQAAGNAKADWWAISQVAQKMGYADEFDYQNAHQVFCEHAALSGFENQASRAFDISGLKDISAQEYDSLEPIQWPVNTANPNGTPRLFSDGQFYTASGKARLVVSKAELNSFVKEPLQEGSFLLNTGRLRDQWHTMTRTGHAPSLGGRHDVPSIEINPKSAEKLAIKDNQMLRLNNSHGSYIAAALISDSVKPGHVFAPIHWNDEFASNAIVSELFGSTVDAFSGQPESKLSRVRLSVYELKTWARIASPKPIDCSQFDYWAQAKTKRGYLTLVGSDQVMDWRAWAQSKFDAEQQSSQEELHFTEYRDHASESHRLVASQGQQIQLLIYGNSDVETLPSFQWLSSAFDGNDYEGITRLLRSEAGGQDQLVCGCFNVSRKVISSAIDDGANSLSDLASQLGCGSKCGSCRPELSALLKNIKLKT